MAVLDVLSAGEQSRWTQALGRACLHDFYHTASYHLLARARGEGEPYLFAFQNGRYTVAVPLLLRELTDGLRDGTSVYGYAGPVTSHPAIPGKVIREFGDRLSSVLSDMGVVSVFSRLHPLLPQTACLDGLGECLDIGQTVSINLSDSLETQRAAYRRSYKHVLNRLRREGFTVVEDTQGIFVDAFSAIYEETMIRVHASQEYSFGPGQFRALLEAPESYMHLFMVLLEGVPVSGGLFSAMNGIVQYHLGGTSTEWLPCAPMKLLFDEVRIWATRSNMRVFHLGGGIGSKQDSLFYFKAGFSRTRHPFSVWHWIVMAEKYAELCSQMAEGGTTGPCQDSPGFFPLYRMTHESGPCLAHTRQ